MKYLVPTLKEFEEFKIGYSAFAPDFACLADILSWDDFIKMIPLNGQVESVMTTISQNKAKSLWLALDLPTTSNTAYNIIDNNTDIMLHLRLTKVKISFFKTRWIGVMVLLLNDTKEQFRLTTFESTTLTGIFSQALKVKSSV